MFQGCYQTADRLTSSVLSPFLRHTFSWSQSAIYFQTISKGSGHLLSQMLLYIPLDNGVPNPRMSQSPPPTNHQQTMLLKFIHCNGRLVASLLCLVRRPLDLSVGWLTLLLPRSLRMISSWRDMHIYIPAANQRASGLVPRFLFLRRWTQRCRCSTRWHSSS